MDNRRNYYRLLQVQPDAPVEVIHASFRALMRELKLHPDLGGSDGEAALLIHAWHTLRDPVRRAAYDLELFRKYPKRAVAGGGIGARASRLCPFCKAPVGRTSEEGGRCRVCKSLLVPRPGERPGRRRLPRMEKNGPVFYRSFGRKHAREAGLVDLSPRGLRFLCEERLPVKSVLQLKGDRLEAVAEVTNVSAARVEGKELYQVGVRFLAVDFEEVRGTFFSTSG